MNIDALKQTVDLVTLVEQSGGQLRRHGNEWRGACPIHRGNNPTGFVVYDDQHWRCFSSDCGSGDALDLVMKLKGISLTEAYRLLGGQDKVDPLEVSRLAAERAERTIKEMESKLVEYQRVLDDLKQTQVWLKYATELETNQRARQLWKMRGIGEDFQSYWQLGYCPDFTITTDAGKWHTPTLTIPIFGKGWTPLNIRHRLLNPANPKDKYRPDRPGLKAEPFLCDPDIAYDCERVLIVEGEIKSMVTYATLNSDRWQVIGIPGKNNLKVGEKLLHSDVFICLDPDAQDESIELARMTHGRIVDIPGKIDDLILDKVLDKTSLQSLIREAKRI